MEGLPTTDAEMLAALVRLRRTGGSTKRRLDAFVGGSRLALRFFFAKGRTVAC